MSGEELYGLYVEEMRAESIIIELWDELPATDQEIWEAVAYKVALK